MSLSKQTLARIAAAKRDGGAEAMREYSMACENSPPEHQDDRRARLAAALALAGALFARVRRAARTGADLAPADMRLAVRLLAATEDALHTGNSWIVDLLEDDHWPFDEPIRGLDPYTDSDATLYPDSDETLVEESA